MKWSAKFWWFTPATWNFTTAEERQVGARLLLMLALIFSLLYGPEELIFDKLGIEADVGTFLGGLTSLLPALPITRKLAELMWPELVRNADENAAKRKQTQRGLS
jgi:hypothetical protein